MFLLISAKLAALQKPAEPEPQPVVSKVNGERDRSGDESPMEDDDEEEEQHKEKVKPIGPVKQN